MLFDIQQFYSIISTSAVNVSEFIVSDLISSNSIALASLIEDYAFLTTANSRNFTITSNDNLFLHPTSVNFSTEAMSTFSALVSDPIVYINIEPEYLDEEGLDIRYSFKYTLPDAKLTYPESHIASPSYLHQDLSYLCILQYWYWL